MYHPCDDGVEKGAAGIGQHVVDIRRSAGNKPLMELIEESVDNGKDERSQQRVPAQKRDVRLMEERPPAEPAQDEEHDGVCDLV